MAGAPPPFIAPSSLPYNTTPSSSRYSLQSNTSSPAPTTPQAPPGAISSSTLIATNHPLPLRPPTNTPSSRKTIYDRNLSRSQRAELSRASFSFLFMEMISYAQRRVKGIQDLERRLNEQGYNLGIRALDLLLYRAATSGSSGTASTSSSNPLTGGSNSAGTAGAYPVRPLRILALLNLLTTRLYPMLFTRPADGLEQSTTSVNEYMIIDNSPLTNVYVSVPKEMSQLSVAAYVAGVIEGVSDGAGFGCKVSAHNVNTNSGAEKDGGESGKDEVWPNKTVFLIRFEDWVVERERELERLGVK